ncbi:LHFPL tetraspan subfamily member 6 protein-like isoform X2 [Bombus affinis]|uniref:LHFPL tetraspan subfamily member 6 protein isoform X2 n=1 Tax=Bombus terrestris TaxID=30195 RepID=A0A9C6SQ84_BOMTE|nr:LHFPL tetraspan subfamily member 6 protein isoform X2 [Bombus terrestris]XP_050583166.1 LHFPL tetraspan subfamily member 6 protein-like isoform X2 [Bombus affinis]
MTVLCVLWATLSTVASILACSGFYLPYWIQGRLLGKADAYFSSFRRCNYPRLRTTNAPPEIVYECARYSSFWDIPSAWWQASTVTMGIGVAIALIGALTLLAAVTSFLPHILKTPKHTRVLGSLQLLAVMICGGLVMYPIGWDNREVQESCGKSANVYNLASFKEALNLSERRNTAYDVRVVDGSAHENRTDDDRWNNLAEIVNPITTRCCTISSHRSI